MRSINVVTSIVSKDCLTSDALVPDFSRMDVMHHGSFKLLNILRSAIAAKFHRGGLITDDSKLLTFILF